MPDHSPRRTNGPSWSRPMTDTQTEPATREPPLAVDDEAVRAAVTRLSRPGGAGCSGIERAAILAGGTDPPPHLSRGVPHGGPPEAPGAFTKQGGPSPPPRD